MSDEDDDGKVLVFRNPAGEPIAVPEKIVEENDRTYRAWQLHLQGATWKAIALQEGYLDAQAARYDVSRYMEEARALVGTYSRQERLQTEVARLDQLQAAVWPQAMKGHLPAVKTVLDLVITRVKVLGLDTATAEETQTGPKTVIVPSDDDSFASALNRAIDG